MSGVTDPIADMLTRVRNAGMARHDSVLVPMSKTKQAVADILKDEGFIRDVDTVRSGQWRMLRLRLLYTGRAQTAIRGLKRVSRPGLRVYVGRDEIPRVYGGIGVAILSTSQGLMTGQEARNRGIGGEVLCYVW
ncbi:MAG: 30S ribosomal protein S8 [Chloroflexota bacterium]|nr:30S ribosomal protein S8 [Chloroflexota bacterium]MDE2968571.1 30S ribosomal protein S8 [Chloroflexota bacterium]